MVRLAGIQISCSEEKERNVEKAIKFARIAVEKGANIICFQELFTTHWFPKEMSKAHFSLAEKFDGPSIMRMRELATESEVALVCPIFESGSAPPSPPRGEGISANLVFPPLQGEGEACPERSRRGGDGADCDRRDRPCNPHPPPSLPLEGGGVKKVTSPLKGEELRKVPLLNGRASKVSAYEGEGEGRFSQRERGGEFYNSAVVIDAGGEILGVYRKVHVPQIPLWEEKFYFSPGNLGFPVFKSKFASIGIQICWDNFFPEGSRILAMKGAQIIFSPTGAAFASQSRWETVISSNAIANGVYIFRVNRVGSEEKQDFYGRSFCVSPEGELVDKPTGMKEGIAILDIDLRTIDEVRREWPFFKDRRPETYKEIAEPKAHSA